MISSYKTPTRSSIAAHSTKILERWYSDASLIGYQRTALGGKINDYPYITKTNLF